MGSRTETGASPTAPFPAHPLPVPPVPSRNCFCYWHMSLTRCLQFTTRCHRFPTHCHQFVTYFSQLSTYRVLLLKKANLQKEAFTFNMYLSNHRKTKCKNNHLKSQPCISCIGTRWLYSGITNSLVCCVHDSSNPSLREKISS